MSPPVVIVGAGPVGLLLACLLGQKKQRVELYEKRVGLPDASMAIGITPPSLDILDRLDLKREFIARGVLIPCARVYEQQRLCGVLEFPEMENQILSLPQYHTLRLLRERLSDFDSIKFHEGMEWEPAMSADTSGWIVGCDGAKSSVRDHFNFSFVRKTYPVTFVMADFPDDEGFGSEARIYFSPRGAVESFPLPDRKRRWIAQVLPPSHPDLTTLMERVEAACGVDLRLRDHGAPWVFTPERLLVHSCVKNNVLLCGDAAHVMSPIGGQGMNTGFADAAVLAHLLPDATPTQLHRATRARRRAFRVSSRRVASGMNLGIPTGGTWSRFRENLLRTALHRPAARRILVRIFTMRNLPPEFTLRTVEPERMDSTDCDPEKLERTLDQFHQINRLFSRVRPLLRETVLADLRPGQAAHLVDLGAGACDIPVWLLAAARRKGVDLRITAVDADRRAVQYARERYGNVPGLRILEADALNLESLPPFDYLFANHFLHHLADPQVHRLLEDACRLARRGVVFSDLRRSHWTYRAFSLVARIYRNSFAREDGLLSIRKGFTPDDFRNHPGLNVRTRFPGRIQLLGGVWF